LGNLPLDISKFDNNVQLWMMSDICRSLGQLVSYFDEKCASIADNIDLRMVLYD
jgi:hypothetical protein